MAIYHLNAKVFSRGKGQSAIAAAAYRSGERLVDEQTAEIKHYPGRASRVALSLILLPKDAPERFRQRNTLWNEVERFERRSDARLAREIEVSLPCELTDQQREWLLREFVQSAFIRRGFAVDTNLHKPDRGDPRNFHAHIMFPDRQIGRDGFFAKKDPSINRKEQLLEWREQWARISNRYLKRFGHEARVDHRSLNEQGIDREPTEHVGYAALEMAERGVSADRAEIQQGIVKRNALRASLAQGMAELDRLQQRVANENQLQVAIKDQDLLAVIDLLTRRRPTFSNRDLHRFLTRSIAEPAARADFGAALLAHSSIVPLATTPEGRVTRFTTKAILGVEAQVLRTADNMAQSRRHRLPWMAVSELLHRPEFASIDAEQVDALQHLTRSDTLAILIGRAGTGKSYTLNLMRQAYEENDFSVVGLAFTNKVVQNLNRDGFRQASTIHSEFRALEMGSRSWNARTIVVVDEAAMLSTELMLKLIKQADTTGAKLILSGDDRQLGSIDRGGLFAELVSRYSAAKLLKVRRQHDPEERRASELLGAGKVAEALAIYEKHEAIHWSETQDEAMVALVAQWAKDRAREPDATRMVIASTNADVDRLNAALRQTERDAYRLQSGDQWLNTSRGSEPYAIGDRLQITGNDRQRGLFNGQFGIVEAVAADRMTVRLDGVRGAPVSFDPREFQHFRHGYASTIYKVQGDSIDKLYPYVTNHWRAASAYVALTRHRQGMSLHVARETARDLDQLARLMSRQEDGQAAISYYPVTPLQPIRPGAVVNQEPVAAPPQQFERTPAPTMAAPHQVFPPVAEQGDGHKAAPPAGRRESARGPTQGAGATALGSKPRYRVRADGSFELISGTPLPGADQTTPRLPEPPPKVPIALSAQAAAERRGLQRGGLGAVQRLHRTTREQVNDYLALCRDPAARLGEWVAIDAPVPMVPQIQPAAQPDETPDAAASQTARHRAGPRSAVDGWAEKPTYVEQSQSAMRAIKRLHGPGHVKAGPRTTREIVDDHLALCRNPAANLTAWLALDAPNPAFLPQPAKETRHATPDAYTADRAAGTTLPVRGDALPEVRLRLDKDGRGQLAVDRVSGRPESGAGRPEILQPVRGGGDAKPAELTAPAGLAETVALFQPLPLGPSMTVTMSYGVARMALMNFPAHAPYAPSWPPQAPQEPAQRSEATAAPVPPSMPETPQARSVEPATPVADVTPQPEPRYATFGPISANNEPSNQVRQSYDKPATVAAGDAGRQAFEEAQSDLTKPPAKDATEPLKSPEDTRTHMLIGSNGQLRSMTPRERQIFDFKVSRGELNEASSHASRFTGQKPKPPQSPPNDEPSPHTGPRLVLSLGGRRPPR